MKNSVSRTEAIDICMTVLDQLLSQAAGDGRRAAVEFIRQHCAALKM